MPRMARVVIPGCPHHPPSPFGYGVTAVTQRGNPREDVFFALAAEGARTWVASPRFPRFPLYQPPKKVLDLAGAFG